MLKESEKIEIIKIIQYFFNKQWHLLKNYAENKNISLIGDIPIYVSHDSADVWANQKLFKLNDNGNMVVKSGCPLIISWKMDRFGGIQFMIGIITEKKIMDGGYLG